MCPIATKPSQVRNINTWASTINEIYPNLLSLGTMHPDMEDFAEEAKFLKKKALKSIEIHPDYQMTLITMMKNTLKCLKSLCDNDLFLLTPQV